MKLVSRSAWGARAYRLPSGSIQYSGSRRGVKIHYLGAAYSDRAHSKCDDYIRSVQRLHMDSNGWSDIGYSFLVCTHGYVYEGRGLKRRNSANGNTSLNEAHYAVLGLVGSSGLTQPTTAQLHGLRDAIEYCRKNGPAGSEIKGHRDGYPTACPGAPLYAWVKKGAPRPGGDVPIINPPEDDMPIDKDDVRKVWKTDGIIPNPVSGTDNKYWQPASFLRSTNIRVRGLEADVRELRGQVAATLAVVKEMAANGGSLTAAQAEAAAEAGAQAALAQLGDALTPED